MFGLLFTHKTQFSSHILFGLRHYFDSDKKYQKESRCYKYGHFDVQGFALPDGHGKAAIVDVYVTICE